MHIYIYLGASGDCHVGSRRVYFDIFLRFPTLRLFLRILRSLVRASIRLISALLLLLVVSVVWQVAVSSDWMVIVNNLMTIMQHGGGGGREN